MNVHSTQEEPEQRCARRHGLEGVDTGPTKNELVKNTGVSILSGATASMEATSAGCDLFHDWCHWFDLFGYPGQDQVSLSFFQISSSVLLTGPIAPARSGTDTTRNKLVNTAKTGAVSNVDVNTTPTLIDVHRQFIKAISS